MKTILGLAIGLLGVGAAIGQPAGPRIVPVEKEPFHRPVYSNADVEVLDVVIPPGATTLFHRHIHDLAGLTVTSSPSVSEVLREKPISDAAEPAGAAWFEAIPKPIAHRVTNLGPKEIHYIVFQLLKSADLISEHSVVWEAVRDTSRFREHQGTHPLRGIAPG